MEKLKIVKEDAFKALKTLKEITEHLFYNCQRCCDTELSIVLKYSGNS